MAFQLDLFRLHIPPCGRSSAAHCEVEFSVAYGSYYCIRCGCTAPTVQL